MEEKEIARKYANQVKYHKVTGEEPGSALKEWSYSIRDIARILSIEESVVYDLLIRENIETITVDYWKRVPKSAFHQWYKGQSRYLTQEDRKAVEDLYKTIVSMGCLNQSIVHPREMLKAAFLSNAAAIMMFHNHPSGSLEPSSRSLQKAKQLQRGMVVRVITADHHHLRMQMDS